MNSAGKRVYDPQRLFAYVSCHSLNFSPVMCSGKLQFQVWELQNYQVPLHTLKEITVSLVQSLVDKRRRATTRHDSAAGADLSNWDHTEQRFAFPHPLPF